LSDEEGYATWLRWSFESVLTPSQHEGKRAWSRRRRPQVCPSADTGVTGSHPETLRERVDGLAGLKLTMIDALPDVSGINNCPTSYCQTWHSLVVEVGTTSLFNADEATILVMEVDSWNLVVGEVLGYNADGALGCLRLIEVHGPIKGIASQDGMKVVGEFNR
jgi:hypothetical protein